MANRGFDILEDLAPRGVRLNIPPFLRGKSQTRDDKNEENSVSQDPCRAVYGAD